MPDVGRQVRPDGCRQSALQAQRSCCSRVGVQPSRSSGSAPDVPATPACLPCCTYAACGRAGFRARVVVWWWCCQAACLPAHLPACPPASPACLVASACPACCCRLLCCTASPCLHCCLPRPAAPSCACLTLLCLFSCPFLSPCLPGRVLVASTILAPVTSSDFVAYVT